MASIYTRTGDDGGTGLFGGTRISKDAARVEAYGAVDEANASFGHAKSLLPEGDWRERVHHFQLRLFVLAAELASDPQGAASLDGCIQEHDILDLEALIDDCLAMTGPPTAFVVPGRDERSAAFHEARTVVRRAERRVLTLTRTESVRPELVKFLNRLSDAAYALARLTETWADTERITHIVRRAVARVLQSTIQEHSGALDDQLQRAQALTRAAQERALQLGVPMAIAVVDKVGELISFERMANTLLASTELAINKAWSAVAFRQSTAQLGQQAAAMMPGVETTNRGRVVIFGGGVPIFAGGTLAGAIGVSGGTVEEDCDVANHALASTQHIREMGDSL